MKFIILSCSVEMWKCVVFILCTYAILVQSEDRWLDVQIAQGPVRGHMDPDGGLYVFYNIPYATAPTGVDRFKAPLPPPIFLTTFDAINRNIICPQPFVVMNMRENCLVANVFVPDTAETNLPVLVVVHGGAYQYGHGLQERFRELAKAKRLIVVTFNYRLGVHGFLCLGTEGAPGNAGLKDQVELLRWVNTNIGRFGGNPEDVTLAACSAGSGSVDVLTLSTITKGLFKKAIMESGVSTGAVGVQIDPIENAKYYAKLLNFNEVDDLDKLEEFYTTASFQQLTSSHGAITGNQDVAILFGPCVERDIGRERVVFNAPFSILKQGNYTKIPLMYGFTNMDGAMRLPLFDSWKVQMNEKFSDFLPAELYFESKDVKEEVAQRVKDLYFGKGEPVGQNNIRKYITYFTDVLFGYPMLRSLSTRVEALDDIIYLFEYSFVDSNTPTFPNTDIKGADHCHQFIAVMDEDVTDKTDDYKRMKETLREYWHSFILTGSPSSRDPNLPKWEPASAKRSPHMSLGPVIELKDEILDGRAAFWDTIYEEYYRGPVMPVTSTISTTTEENNPDSTDSAPTTTVPTTTPESGADSARAGSIVMFVLLSLSLYFISC